MPKTFAHFGFWRYMGVLDFRFVGIFSLERKVVSSYLSLTSGIPANTNHQTRVPAK